MQKIPLEKSFEGGEPYLKDKDLKIKKKNSKI